MSVDTSGRSGNGVDRDAAGQSGGGSEAGERPPSADPGASADPGPNADDPEIDGRMARTRRPSALERVAGSIPDGRDVATSLDEFIAEAVAVDARDPGEEHAARAR